MDRSQWRRFLMGLGWSIGLLAGGTFGYILIEGWAPLDALYMTVISVTTVGYGEPAPLSEAGQVFTMVLILLGVGTILYTLAAAALVIIEGDILEHLGLPLRRSKKMNLKDHAILCGFGRVGQEIARQLQGRSIAFIVVDQGAESSRLARQLGYEVVTGDATKDEVLERAGIAQARTVLAAVDSDSQNTYITLTAKALNSEVFVVARTESSLGPARISRAGADRVIAPHLIGASRMVFSATQPVMLDFLDSIVDRASDKHVIADMEATEAQVGRSISDVFRDCKTTTVLGIRRADGHLEVGPRGSIVLAEGDRLILIGDEREFASIR